MRSRAAIDPTDYAPAPSRPIDWPGPVRIRQRASWRRLTAAALAVLALLWLVHAGGGLPWEPGSSPIVLPLAGVVAGLIIVSTTLSGFLISVTLTPEILNVSGIFRQQRIGWDNIADFTVGRHGVWGRNVPHLRLAADQPADGGLGSRLARARRTATIALPGDLEIATPRLLDRLEQWRAYAPYHRANVVSVAD